MYYVLCLTVIIFQTRTIIFFNTSVLMKIYSLTETHDQYVQVNFDGDNILLNMISPESNSTRGIVL